MKQRLTLFISDSLNPWIIQVNQDPSDDGAASIRVDGPDIKIKNVSAIKEQSLTFGIDEIPQEIAELLSQLDSLHIRYVTGQKSVAENGGRARTAGPYAGGMPPGMHAFYTAAPGAYHDEIANALSQVIFERFIMEVRKDPYVFIECTRPLRMASDGQLSAVKSTEHQFYSTTTEPNEGLDELLRGIPELWDTWDDIPKKHHMFNLTRPSNANVFSIDYDKQSEIVTVKLVFDEENLTETVNRQAGSVDRVEVGVLRVEKPLTSKDGRAMSSEHQLAALTLGGHLAVCEEDDKFGPTLFTFPVRHHSLASPAYYTAFDKPTGLHPTLRVTFQTPPLPPQQAISAGTESSCTLHAYFTFPSFVFVDQYTLQDTLVLASHNLTALRSISGATDLELPDYKVYAWGSAAVFDIATLNSSLSSFTIPLHSRYMSPEPGGYATRDVAPPAVFWACSSSVDGEEDLELERKLKLSPFDRLHSGYESLFPAGTVYFHMEPTPAPGAESAQPGAELMVPLTIPVLDTAHLFAGIVEPGTLAVLLLGFLWVAWALVRPVQWEQKQEKEKSGTKRS